MTQITIYHAPVSSSVLVPFKGKEAIDASAFYCPYIPLTMTSVIDRSLPAPVGEALPPFHITFCY